jgi:hypothetical protein
MFKNVLRMGLLGAALLTAGCTPGTLPQLVVPTVAQVQAATVQACSYLPDVVAVANIISATNTMISTAAGIASQICSVVFAPPKSAARFGATLPTVNGVVVTGHFVAGRRLR